MQFKLEKALSDNKNDLINVLGYEKYEMLVPAQDYLMNRQKMRERDIGRLERLAGDYRPSSLRHHVSRGLGVGESMAGYAQGTDERTESFPFYYTKQGEQEIFLREVVKKG